jgi:hypothetical protein
MGHSYLEPFLSEEVQYQGGYFVPSGSGLEICETAPIYCPRNPEALTQKGSNMRSDIGHGFLLE